MKKQTSKSRWIARLKLMKLIPWRAVVEHELYKKFKSLKLINSTHAPECGLAAVEVFETKFANKSLSDVINQFNKNKKGLV